MVDTQELAVTASAADDAAENVAAALVGGDDAVGDHEHSRLDVVGADADGDIVVLVGTVLLTRDLGNRVQDPAVGVHQEHIVHVLHDAGQTLQTHTRVDVLLGQLGVVAVAVVVELGEDVVPDLHEAVAVTAGLAVGRAAAASLAAVEVDLGAGAAGTRAMLPEVVGLAQADDALGGNADHVGPQVIGLLVLLVDGGPEQVLGDLQGHGEELPSPRNGLVLEVVAEGEVTQHLEEGAVTGCVTHALQVGGTDALLAGANAIAGRDLLAREELLHGSHTRVDEEQGRVIVGNQGIGGESQVILGLKECEVFLAQIVKRCPLHDGVAFLFYV